MKVLPIPCLSDNYAYLLVESAGRRAVAVDPSEAAPVRDALSEHGLALSAIWLTHHHWDHVGGVEDLCREHPEIPVVGSRYDQKHGRIPNQTQGVEAGDSLDFDGLPVTLLEIPGHTLGAIGYVIDGNLFSGDTLFLAGCGRVFEGTMEMMAQSLAKLRELPSSTLVWCGHEYTVKNLEFAKSVEPDNASIAEALEEAKLRRADGDFTVPGQLQRELETNPFLRLDREPLAQGRDAVATFTAIRKAKDSF